MAAQALGRGLVYPTDQLGQRAAVRHEELLEHTFTSKFPGFLSSLGQCTSQLIINRRCIRALPWPVSLALAHGWTQAFIPYGMLDFIIVEYNSSRITGFRIQVLAKQLGQCVVTQLFQGTSASVQCLMVPGF